MTVVATAANKPKIRGVRPDEVTTDLRVQRPLDQKRVTDMVAKFRIDALGVPTVSVRPDGTMIWLDGQTRGAALKELGMGSRTVQCSCYEGLTLKQEAELFRILNDSKRLTANDQFRIAITEGDPIATGADKMLRVYGWTSETGRTNTCKAVNTLYRAYEQDQQALRRALELLAGSWGATHAAIQATLLQGAFNFMARYGESFQVEVDRLRDKLAKEAGGPSAFIGRARGNAKTRAIPVPDGVADILVGLYNRNRKSGVVPQWMTK
jgi:hypothetical protein